MHSCSRWKWTLNAWHSSVWTWKCSDRLQLGGSFEREVRQTLSHLVERVKKFARTVAAQPKSMTRMKDRRGDISHHHLRFVQVAPRREVRQYSRREKSNYLTRI